MGAELNPKGDFLVNPDAHFPKAGAGCRLCLNLRTQVSV